MERDVNNPLNLGEEGTVEEFDPRKQAARLIEMAELLTGSSSDESAGSKETGTRLCFASCDEGWKAEFWRQVSTGALSRFKECNFNRFNSLETDYRAKIFGVMLLADWVEIDIIAFEIEKSHVEFLKQEECRFREMMNRLPAMTEKLVKACNQTMKDAGRKKEVMKILGKMFNSLCSRCPLPNNTQCSLVLRRAEFHDVIVAIFNKGFQLEQVMESARERFISARETNYEIIYNLSNSINEMAKVLARFVSDNVLPILDFLNRQRHDYMTGWRETCVSMQAELNDYLSKLGISSMPVFAGEPLDPERHEPADLSDVQIGKQIIAEVLMAGYELETRGMGTGKTVVRRALVETRPHHGVSGIES